MSSGPRVSVIIIVLDGEAYLDESISSVHAQSFVDWELLIVDDGSLDSSVDIALRHGVTDHRVTLLQHPEGANLGMSASRNFGLAHARGDFVAFLDADDVWLPGKLEEQLATFDHHPNVAMVYGRTLIWRSWSGASADADTFFDLGVAPDRLHFPSRLFRNLLRNVYQTPTTCNAILRRSAIESVGGFEPSFRAMFEDQVFFSKVLLRFPVWVSARVWAKYRQHDLSTSAIAAKNNEEDAEQLRYLLWLRAYVATHHRTQFINRAAVEKAIFDVRWLGWKRWLKCQLPNMWVRTL